MNEQSPKPELEPLDRHEARRQRRAERLADPSRAGTWITGTILIVLGAMFLMRSNGAFYIPLRNWWALFILIPAVGGLDTAFRTYRSAGNQWNTQARSSLLVGLVLLVVTGMFLFNLSWTWIGPLLIILVGIAILANAMIRQE